MTLTYSANAVRASGKLTLSGAVRTNAVLVGANAEVVEAAKAQTSNTSFMVSKKKVMMMQSVCWHDESGRFSSAKDFSTSSTKKLPPMTTDASFFELQHAPWPPVDYVLRSPITHNAIRSHYCTAKRVVPCLLLA